MIKAHDLMVYLSIKYKNDWDKIHDHIWQRLPLDKEEMKKILEKVDLDNYIAITDADYPDEFKMMKRPPFAMERDDCESIVTIIRNLKK